MTEADAVVYLRSIRDDLASRLYVGMTPEKKGDYLSKTKAPSRASDTSQIYYKNRIAALDVAIVYLSLKI